MSLYGYPILYALVAWWFSTGVVLFLDGLPPRTFKWSVLGFTLLLGASVWGLFATRHDASVAGAYAGFTYGLLAWAWLEITFYTGWVTGPRKAPCDEGCAGWRHFGHAIAASLWHELAILAIGGVVVWATWDGENRIGTWTYVVLWWMHQSAKLNVFLGVRNLNAEFLPDHLPFLRSFLTKKPINLLFPVSVTVSTIVAVLLWNAALAAEADPFGAAGATFLAALMTLAILEHWLLVLPLPSAGLWRWGLASRKRLPPVDVEVVAGFLGAGKTTWLRRRLGELAGSDATARPLVLVNDFAAVGVDGALLAGRGAEVVELPDGCICCTLRGDLGRQLREAIQRYRPRRVLIEPSGVADLATLIEVLHRDDVKPLVGRLDVVALFDAASFLADWARLPGHLEAQARAAARLVVNKADLVDAAGLRLVAATLRAANPAAAIVAARWGMADQGLTGALNVAPAPGARDASAHAGHRHAATPDFAAWSAALPASCDADELLNVLEAAAQGAYGEVERLKGIAPVGAGWVRFDLAGGRPSIAAFAPRAGEEPRVVAIGRLLDELKLQSAFAACAWGGMTEAAR